MLGNYYWNIQGSISLNVGRGGIYSSQTKVTSRNEKGENERVTLKEYYNQGMGSSIKPKVNT